jgi:hypothetical protein
MRHSLPLLIGSMAALVFSASCGQGTGAISIVNQSQEHISTIAIVLPGETIRVTDLEPREVADVTYRITAEGEYSVAVQFRSGKRLQTVGTYITSGVENQDQIVVTDAEIKITSMVRPRGGS